MAPGIEEDAVLPFHEELAKKFKSKPHVQTIANALTEVITDRKGPLSPASYFGVIITSLSDGKEKTEEEIASLLAVLTFVFEKLSIAILRMKFAHAAGVLLNIFEQCAQSAPILNKLTKCISLLIQVQEPATLQQEARNCLQLLLTLSADDRSSVVRASHSAILSIIKSATPQTRKLLCSPLTQYFITTLSQGASAEEACISALKLIKLVFPYMPANNIGTLCEAILQVPTHSIAVLTTAAYQSIGGLLGTRDEEDDTVVELGAAQLNALAEALIDVQPHFNDVRPLIEYSFLMASLYVELARADEDSCSQKLPTLFEHFVPNFAAENPEIANATHDALTMLVQKCISDNMIQQGSKAAHSPLRRIVATMETSLSPQYHRNWNKALLVIAALFERLGTHSSTFLAPILTTVGELYNTLTPQIHMPVFAVLGYAISAMGPKRFLEILPLNLDSPEFGAGDRPNRAWLLPLLRSNIEQTELKFFVDYFIPLGTQISTLAQKAEATGKAVEAKNKNIVADQIWDLFPAFCDLPVDLAQSFKAIAKTLGTLINDVPARRKVVFAGLLKLLEKNKEVAKSENSDPSIRVTPDMAKAGLKAMGMFSKNFLPILFAQYEKLCTGEAAAEFRQREALFNLIAAYISISEPQIVTQFFKTLMQKLLETSTEAKGDEADEEMDDEAKEKKEKEKQAADKRRRALIDSYTDLTSAFVPSLSLTDLDFLYRVIKPYFTSQSIHLQKKSYKVLRAMCSQPAFVKKFYDEIRDMVLKTLHECSSTAKKQRIYVLQELLPHMELKDIMTPAIIADIIFSSREISAGSRKVALQLVSKIAHKAQENGGTEGLQDFVNLLVAGLAGTTPVMMSGSIFALTRIVVDFKDVLSPVFINELFSTLTLLLQSKHVEVMTASVLFIKTTLNIVDIEDIPKHMKLLAEGFAMMMREHKGKFREYAQPVLARLIKKFGYEEVAKHFPEESHKVLRATHKQERQKKDKTKKEKPEKGGEGESSDEDDAEFLGENLLGDKAFDKEGEEGETFIIEEEEPVDFLDKKAMKSVISAKPQGKVEKSKKKNEFKMLPDGRLLIQDSDDEDSHDIYYNEKDKLPIDDRMLDEVDKEMFGNKSRKMTKKRMLEEANRAEEHDQEDDPEAVRPINEKFKKNRAKPKPYAGHQFKAKKAGGDVKIGKLDPFAYIPLDMRNLNKRRRLQAVLPFKALAKGAKRSKT